MQILQRQCGEKGFHSAELVTVNRHLANGVVAYFRNAELDVCCGPSNPEQSLRAAVPRQYIAKVGPAPSGFLRLLLESLKFSEPASNLEVCRSFTAVAGRVSDCCQWVDMIDVELSLVQH